VDEINPVALTTTLYSLRKHHACESRYWHLVGALGTKWGDKEPINLLTILEHNGARDCLWALCATDQNCDKVARLMAADFAEAVLPIYERHYPGKMQPRVAIQAARDYAHGRIGITVMEAARDAAVVAGAGSWASKDVAGVAAWRAGMAAWASWAAARESSVFARYAAEYAGGATGDAYGRDWDESQKIIIRKYLKVSD